jgi:hypothetical protein
MPRLSTICCVLLFATAARGAERYVAVNGSNSGGNTGTNINAPLATIAQAITLSQPGDTIWVRGGTYNLASTISIGSSKSGTAANPYKLLAYPGEAPVLDFRAQPYSANNSGMKGISLNGSYWRIKGLTIQYAADNGLAIGGSNNIVEQCVARQNQDSGFQISGSGPSNNLLLNCDSYANFDYGNLGENADGFAVKFRGLGPGNVISGARSYENADDGFDFWQAEHGVTVVNSWSFHNGVPAVFNNPAGYQGDSNGLKLGHDSGTHVLKNLLVWGNIVHGIDINGNALDLESSSNPAIISHGVQILNVTSVGNLGRNFNFDENPTLASPPTQHILRNNISFNGSVRIDAGNTADHNTFNGPSGSPPGLGATAADFVSTVDPVTTPGNYRPAGTGGDRSGVTMPVFPTGPALAPRLADGSLPPLDFMRLQPTSHLIDAGVDVGLPFLGSAPDVGWLEYAPPVVYSPADFNRDGKVDAADLDKILTNYGLESGALSADGDATGDGAINSADFLVWQQQVTPPTATAPAGAAVPEPATGGAALFAASTVIAFARRRGAGARPTDQERLSCIAA